jgi:hypothetical protein
MTVLCVFCVRTYRFSMTVMSLSTATCLECSNLLHRVTLSCLQGYFDSAARPRAMPPSFSEGWCVTLDSSGGDMEAFGASFGAREGMRLNLNQAGNALLSSMLLNVHSMETYVFLPTLNSIHTSHVRYARRPLMAVGARGLSGVAQRQYLIQFMHDMECHA